ncbi:furin-like [Lethenteron reissneri]|uniref:furin-like n=1 Tax=Lethenteron reissneri TaxID=7753 RepID=UPI002AB6BFFA|nr:furin-like [Lethenteron reissneri]XP_061411346.1 furin-like [Lethenteron reissneri]XP_061435836.1 furin-like [Lethenteron reissneri]XP_061436485.1 furin-like [Lethenteron reissneri]
MRPTLALLACAAWLVACGVRGQPRDVYTHTWAVLVPGGAAAADDVAGRHGFTNLGQIFGDYYHFRHRAVAKRSLSRHHNRNLKLQKEPKVQWAEQQVVKARRKRELFQEPTDPKYLLQWYLHNSVHHDLNVLAAWSQGVSGRGVVVSILDDGIEKNHPDLVSNYDPMASYDVNSNDPDPQPRYTEMNDNRHGTRCAGEVAAAANNDVCGVGIAYNARIGGVRMLDGDVTDAVEARSLSLNPQHIAVYSASWGPEDDGKTVDGPARLAQEAFVRGITKGRGGLGSIFVWASGNGGREKDSCNCDGYTNSIYTLSISSTTEKGNVPWYSEACSSTLATTYSSGAIGEKQIVTTDLRLKCTESHTGTSASAPLAAGIIALALEANPRLTWRDMQHLVVRTSNPSHLHASDWVTNGVGRKVSHSYGYGLLDAGAIVTLARNWTTVPPQRACTMEMSTEARPIGQKLLVSGRVSSCLGTGDYVTTLEHVQARLTLAFSHRGELAVRLTSPMGTRCTLLAPRPHDFSTEGFNDWAFMSTHSWGEDPTGVWTLELENTGSVRNTGTLKRFTLVLYGTAHRKRSLQGVPTVASSVACRARDPAGLCVECRPPFLLLGHACVQRCPNGTFAREPEQQPGGARRRRWLRERQWRPEDSEDSEEHRVTEQQWKRDDWQQHFPPSRGGPSSSSSSPPPPRLAAAGASSSSSSPSLCEECDASCVSCWGPGPAACLSCAPHSRLVASRCVPQPQVGRASPPLSLSSSGDGDGGASPEATTPPLVDLRRAAAVACVAAVALFAVLFAVLQLRSGECGAGARALRTVWFTSAGGGGGGGGGGGSCCCGDVGESGGGGGMAVSYEELSAKAPDEGFMDEDSDAELHSETRAFIQG